jgi:hypothetical protein
VIWDLEPAGQGKLALAKSGGQWASWFAVHLNVKSKEML